MGHADQIETANYSFPRMHIYSLIVYTFQTGKNMCYVDTHAFNPVATYNINMETCGGILGNAKDKSVQLMKC